MKTKNTMPITEGRKEIFSIAQKLQKGSEPFTLTERGKPTVVLLAAEKFEKMLEKISGASSLYSGKFHQGVVCDKDSKTAYQTKNDFLYEIIEPKDKVIIVREGASIVYSSEEAINKINSSQKLLIAQLYVELIEKYHYPLNSIKLGALVRIGKEQSNHFIEADILVRGEDKNANLIFAVSEFENYEKNKEEKIKELFELAREFEKTNQKISFLIYFSRKYEKDKLKEKIIVINREKFETINLWKKKGMPFEKNIATCKK